MDRITVYIYMLVHNSFNIRYYLDISFHSWEHFSVLAQLTTPNTKNTSSFDLYKTAKG